MNILGQWKKLLPRVVISTMVALACVYYSETHQVDDLHGVAGVIAGVSGTLLGFLITSMALITAIMDRTLIANMRRTGHYQRLIADTFTTCAVLLGTVVFCITSLFFSNPIHVWVFAASLFFLALSVLYVIEAGRRFSNIISTLS